MKLWHDDIRTPPEPREEWTWARTNEEAVDLLLTGEVTEASLDHDLGLKFVDPSHPQADALRGDGFQTGADLARWMAANPEFIPRKVTLHSWSPPGAARMQRILLESSNPPDDLIVEPFAR